MKVIKFLSFLSCIIFCQSVVCSGMKITVAFENKFTIDPVVTEYQAYRCLQEKPLKASIDYYALPWALMINTGNLSRVPMHSLPGGYTICQHIRFAEIIPLLEKMGITTLFTPHVMKGQKFGKVTVLPFPHYAVNGIKPAANKDVFYSFIGSNTDKVRKKLFDMKHPKDAIVKSRGIWHFASANKIKEKQEYQDVLARSRYSLCPRGTGSSTIRFWESLEAGAIPVMIGDDMWLPEPFDWNSCMVIIKEKDINNIAEILRAIPADKQESMKKKSLEAFEKFSGPNFVSTIRYHIDKEVL